ncbi:hypothetical protein ACTFIV_006287 [Dictyostelium citrinum]
MLIKEYRITLPFTKEEYRLGQKYMTARKTHESSSAGDNVELLEKSAFTDKNGVKGIYTHKVFLLKKSLPRYASAILPKSALKIEEKAWNSYPNTKTIYSCPFFGEKFYLCIESIHKDGRDEEDNVFGLSKDILKKRIVDHVDIARDEIEGKEVKPDEDPKLFKSKLTGRGPLTSKNWRKEVNPAMVVYKLVTVNFNYWGFQTKVENLVQTNGLREVFLKAHRSLFCWMDEWIDLSEEQIEQFEQSTYQLMMDNNSIEKKLNEDLNNMHISEKNRISSKNENQPINYSKGDFKCPNVNCQHVCNECKHMMMTTTTTTTKTVTETTTTVQSPICYRNLNPDSINVMN